MKLDEFNSLNLHDIVRFKGQSHSVVHLNRRAGSAYLRPAPGWGGIVGPISFADMWANVSVGQWETVSVPTLVAAPPSASAPSDDDTTMEFVFLR